jgi:hypothetical protein
MEGFLSYCVVTSGEKVRKREEETRGTEEEGW